MRRPAFWESVNLVSVLLFPLSFVYLIGLWVDRAFKLLFAYRAKRPVICVGNFTVGGSGKTPVVVWLIKYLANLGLKPVVVYRGYGAEADLSRPVKVDVKEHGAKDVGDEAFMVAFKTKVPVIVCSDKKDAVKRAEEEKADIIIMDDGLQNFSVKKDFSVAVFDGKYGVGNGMLLPAGPLRENVWCGLKRVDAAVFVGDGGMELKERVRKYIPVFDAEIKSVEKDMKHLKGKDVVAFAGIGDPDKFFDTLKKLGISLKGVRRFPDHYNYSEKDLDKLSILGDVLLTTEKDYVKLPYRYRDKVYAVPVELEIKDEEGLANLLRNAIISS